MKLIQKCGYIMAGGGGAYMKYIATREGVELIENDAPATKKQQALIADVLHDFPDSKELFEYEDYTSKPTAGNASAFLSAALDRNAHTIQDGDIYMKYIATRPRAEKHGDHGLFGQALHVDLAAAMRELEEHKGNTWTIIYSLRREDASRLGYDSAEAWRRLLLSKQAEIAEAMKIAPEHLHWYAAFHDEGHHPHVHMMLWSDVPRQGYLSKDGVKAMRSALTNEIFKNEMYQLYVQKDLSYKELTTQAQETMRGLVEKMQGQICDSPMIEQKMQELVFVLGSVKGKKQYGFLPKEIKGIVDSIVDELSKQPEVAACYDAWNKLRDELEAYYKDKPREHLPISRQKEFRAIKNMVIREAENIRLGSVSFEDDEAVDAEELPTLEKAAENGDGRAMYRLARLCMAGEGVQGDMNTGLAWLRHSAEQGNPYAQYSLGKMYLQGNELPQDKKEALRWLESSAAQGNVYAQYLIDRMDEQHDPSVMMAATRLLHHASRIFRERAMTENPKGIRVDSRRRKQFLQKRLALGHKIDDHEESGQSMKY